MISFIVSAYNRPELLRCCLTSIAAQETALGAYGYNEVIVCDNDLGSRHMTMTVELSKYMLGKVSYTHTALFAAQTCYHGMEVRPEYEWLCFPNDDSYYVPAFGRIMQSAAQRNGWEFVYCDCVYDSRLAKCHGIQEEQYSVLLVEPRIGAIDKTCFIVSRRAFELVGGWPEHSSDYRDGALAEVLVRAGVKHGKAGGVLVVHN